MIIQCLETKILNEIVDVFSFLIQTGENIFLSHHKLNPNEIKDTFFPTDDEGEDDGYSNNQGYRNRF